MQVVLSGANRSLGTINIVDDHQEQYRKVKATLRGIGYRVRAWKSVSDVRVQDVKPNSFWVVDRRFGDKNEPKGDELVEKLLNKGNVRVVLLTAFSLPEVLGQILHNVAKNTFFVRLAKLSEEIIAFDAIPRFLDRFFSSDKLPEFMDLKEFQQDSEIKSFRSLSEGEQDVIFDEVTANFQGEVKKLWARGALWVGIFGQTRKAVKAVYSSSDIPDEDMIELLEDNYGLPCFEYDCSASFHNTNLCFGSGRGGEHVGTYPALYFDNSDDEECSNDRFGIHFDSGSDLSLLCERFAKKIESVSFGKRKKTIPLHSSLARVQAVSAKLLLKARKHGDVPDDEDFELSKLVSVTGYSVRDWQQSDFKMICSDACVRNAAGGFCKLRSRGIIGRNFVAENEINLVMRHSNSEIEVFDD